MFSSAGHAPSVNSLKEYQLKTGSGKEGKERRTTIENLASQTAQDDELLNLIRASTQQTYASSRELERVAGSYHTHSIPLEPVWGSDLKLIAQLIDAGIPERVYYTTLGGFDTHAGPWKPTPVC